MKIKMNTKNVMVSFLAIMTALFLLSTVQAGDIADNMLIKVDGTYVDFYPQQTYTCGCGCVYDNIGDYHNCPCGMP